MTDKNHIPIIEPNDGQGMRDKIRELNKLLSAKEQECAKLKIDASHHAYNCDRAKRERDKAEAENASLRADNERLKKIIESDKETHERAEYSLRKRCEDLEAKMKENMMIAFTAGHCMVPGDVSFEEWYKDFLKTKRIASKKGADLEEAATKLGEIVDCYSRMDYDDQDIIKDIAPRIFAIIQNELKKIDK